MRNAVQTWDLDLLLVLRARKVVHVLGQMILSVGTVKDTLVFGYVVTKEYRTL
jgi:hypothetical protein